MIFFANVHSFGYCTCYPWSPVASSSPPLLLVYKWLLTSTFTSTTSVITAQHHVGFITSVFTTL
jgi:hypothetical protein